MGEIFFYFLNMQSFSLGTQCLDRQVQLPYTLFLVFPPVRELSRTSAGRSIMKHKVHYCLQQTFADIFWGNRGDPEALRKPHHCTVPAIILGWARETVLSGGLRTPFTRNKSQTAAIIDSNVLMTPCSKTPTVYIHHKSFSLSFGGFHCINAGFAIFLYYLKS